MRSRVIGSPLTTTVVLPASTFQPLTDQTDVYAVKGDGSHPVLLLMPTNPNDGDSFCVEDAAGNAQTVPIGIFSTGVGSQPFIGGLSSGTQTVISTNFGGLQFTYSSFAGGWLVASYLGGGATPLPAANDTNWVTLYAPNVVHSQSSNGLNICIAAVTLVAQFSGVFDVRCRLGCSSDTTAKHIHHQFFTHQGTTPTGTLAGGIATGAFGSGVVVAGSHGEYLNVDGTGTPGVTFEGGFIGGPVGQLQYGESVPTLTGLLTADGAAPINFGFSGIVNANGSSNPNVVTPFTRGLAVGFGITLLTTAGCVVSYEELIISVRELAAA